jgi:hypothetical protein
MRIAEGPQSLVLGKGNYVSGECKPISPVIFRVLRSAHKKTFATFSEAMHSYTN